MDLATDPAWLAEGLTTSVLTALCTSLPGRALRPSGRNKGACVNLGRRVTFDLPDGGQGAGEAVDVDEEGRLVVRTDAGEQHVLPAKCRCTAFTGQYKG